MRPKLIIWVGTRIFEIRKKPKQLVTYPRIKKPQLASASGSYQIIGFARL